MISREIHYRLLGGAYGPRIARAAAPGGAMPRISEAIRRLKADLARPVRVADLAKVAGMSPSAFHQHFKEITAMSPLQYVKRLRLTEARQLMLAERITAAGAAYRVGYESPSQFSRDYSRVFGIPPMRDIGRIRSGVPSAL
jgi:transcriptional regulator GlxA family with amidase domain